MCNIFFLLVNVPNIPTTTDNFLGYTDQLLNYFKETSIKCSIYGKSIDCEEPNYIKIVQNNPKQNTTCLVQKRTLVSGPKLIHATKGLVVYRDFLKSGFAYSLTKKVSGEIVYEKYLKEALNKLKMIEKHEYSSKTMTWKRLLLEDTQNVVDKNTTGTENLTAQEEKDVKKKSVDDGKKESKNGYQCFADTEKKENLAKT